MNRKAFTLIEILSVLVVVSVLVIISIPSITDMLEKSKQKSKEEVLEMVKTAAEMYAIDYKIGLAEPIYITELCKNYLSCPIKDPITDNEITGYLYSRIDKANSNAIVYEIVSGTPILLNNTILTTVNNKDISVNKYAGNGLYKWGDKYIYRGGFTRSNPDGLATANGYLTDTISGEDVNNFIQVPWETYTSGETCTSESNKCYRIMGINEDSSINIIRDKGDFSVAFDNVHNTAASNYYSNPSHDYGYSDLLENEPLSEHSSEYRKTSNFYNAVFAKGGYEDITFSAYNTMLENIDICLNKYIIIVGLNKTDYDTTPYIKDSCDIFGKSSTKSVFPLKGRKMRLFYSEEYLNSSTEPTCNAYGQYQCRNQNYLYKIEPTRSLNSDFRYSWFNKAIDYGGNLTNFPSYSNTKIRPVVTLKKDLIITSGDGSASNPYVIAN